jgi:hypothetical protein
MNGPCNMCMNEWRDVQRILMGRREGETALGRGNKNMKWVRV